MIKILGQGNGQLRIAAINAVGQLKATSALPLLLKFLEQDNEGQYIHGFSNNSIIQTTVTALGEIGDPIAVPALLAAANYNQGYEPQEIRRCTIMALSLIDDPRTTSAIVEKIQSHDSEEIRAIAIASLGNKRDLLAHSTLESLLNNDEYIELPPYIHKGGILDNLKFINSEKISSVAYQALEHMGTPQALATAQRWRNQHREVDN